MAINCQMCLKIHTFGNLSCFSAIFPFKINQSNAQLSASPAAISFPLSPAASVLPSAPRVLNWHFQSLERVVFKV